MERLTISNKPPALSSGITVVRGDGRRAFPWWLLFVGAGAGFALWAFLRGVKPKSMPIVLPMTSREFSARMLQAARAALPGATPRVHQMIVAHAAYESGWGKAKAHREANNPFNLTTISGSFIPGPDQECTPDGKCRGITQKWAVFPSLEAGTSGYLRFIQAKRYTDAYNRLVNADIGFLDSLYRGGYFTLPLEAYKQNYLSVLNRVARESQGVA